MRIAVHSSTKEGGEEEEEIVLPISFPRGCHKKGGGGEDPKCFFPFFSRLEMVLLFSRFLFPSYLVIETFGLLNKRKSKESLFIFLHVLEKVRFVATLPLHEKWVGVTSFVSFALKASCCMQKPCLLKDSSFPPFQVATSDLELRLHRNENRRRRRRMPTPRASGGGRTKMMNNPPLPAPLQKKTPTYTAED